MKQMYVLYEVSVMTDGTTPAGAFVHSNVTEDEIKATFHTIVASKYANDGVLSAVVKVFDVLGNEILSENINKETNTNNTMEE